MEKLKKKILIQFHTKLINPNDKFYFDAKYNYLQQNKSKWNPLQTNHYLMTLLIQLIFSQKHKISILLANNENSISLIPVFSIGNSYAREHKIPLAKKSYIIYFDLFCLMP